MYKILQEYMRDEAMQYLLHKFYIKCCTKDHVNIVGDRNLEARFVHAPTNHLRKHDAKAT